MQPRPITLMAMSGVGKTELSWKLEKWGWHHYNCDYLIGTKYLADELDVPLKLDDLSPLSRYIGQIGNTKTGGGLPIKEFKRRQNNYIEAEKKVLRDMRVAIRDSGAKLVNDSTGSLCEIEDESVFRQLAEDSLFVYIKAGPEQEEALVARAVADPKPLYYPPAKFDGWIKEYLEEHRLKTIEDIVPDNFSRWVFPKLFHSRIPKYERLAGKYGITISSADVWDLKSEDEFLQLIEKLI